MGGQEQPGGFFYFIHFLGTMHDYQRGTDAVNGRGWKFFLFGESGTNCEDREQPEVYTLRMFSRQQFESFFAIFAESWGDAMAAPARSGTIIR